MLQATDLVATLPRRLALWATTHFSLVLLDLTYTPKTVDRASEGKAVLLAGCWAHTRRAFYKSTSWIGDAIREIADDTDRLAAIAHKQIEAAV